MKLRNVLYGVLQNMSVPVSTESGSYAYSVCERIQRTEPKVCTIR